MFTINFPNKNLFSRHSMYPIINDNIYKFTFKNNFRANLMELSIFIVEGSDETEVAKNISLFPNIDLAKFITNENWSGRLFLYDKTGKKRTPFRKLSDEFEFIWIADD